MVIFHSYVSLPEGNEKSGADQEQGIHHGKMYPNEISILMKSPCWLNHDLPLLKSVKNPSFRR